MDAATLELLEYHEVLGIIAGNTSTPQGRESVYRLQPLETREEIRIVEEEIEEAVRFRSEGGRIHFDLPDIDDILQELKSPSSLLEPVQFLAVFHYLHFLELCRRELAAGSTPRLLSYAEQVPLPRGLMGRIDNAIDEKGNIRESAHPELADVRRSHSRARAQVQEFLRRIMDGPKSRFLIDEPFITQRADRFVLPVRVEHQRDIPGIVHGASSSAATVFLEPLGAVDLNNQVIFYRERESEIIREILRSLSQEARSHLPDLEGIIDFSGLLEARLAVALFSERLRCRPAFLAEEPTLVLRSARHPLLVESLGDKGVVPIDITMPSGRKVLVISGPNTGGKTAALKTVGLLSLMAHGGLPVPAAEATIPFFHGIHADVGDHQSITQQLSTFSSHISRIRDLTKFDESPSLLLLDELGRGTDPSYGAALAIAVIRHFLGNRDCLILCTTHHRALKSWAALSEGVQNASVGLDESTGRPTYRLEFGVAGESSGLEIARQMGLDDSIIAHVRSLLDDKESLTEAYLRQLRGQLDGLEAQREELRSKEREIALAAERMRLETESHQRDLEKRMEVDLETLAKEFRLESRRFFQKYEERLDAKEIRLQIQMRESALKEEFRRKAKARSVAKETAGAAASKVDTGLSEGDLVFHPLFRVRGTVAEVNGPQAVVLVEGKSLTVKAADLQRIERQTVAGKVATGITYSVVTDTDPELNLIGRTTDEASDVIDKFLDRAVMSKLREVRIIHGFGTGRLKSFIADFLARHPLVASFQTEGGATVVQLRD